jgi:predicted ATP-dependent protease
MNITKVKAEDLKINIRFDKSTKEYNPKPIFFSQERVEKAFETGLKVNKEGYNIYVSGEDGIGRTTYTKMKLEEHAKNLPVPEDIIYYHNFEDPYKPRVLIVKSGLGKKLESSINEIIEKLKKEVYKVFESKEYEEEKLKLIKDAEEKREKILEKLKTDANKHNLGVLFTSYGIELVPIINGKIITNLNILTDKQYKEYQENLNKFDDKFLDYVQQLREIDEYLDGVLKDLKLKISKFKLDSLYYKHEKEFKEHKEILEFLKYHKENVLNNIDLFIELRFTEKNSIFYRSLEQEIKKFKINLFVDNSNLNYAPVIFETNPSFKNLFGGINFEAEMGILFTSHNNIFAGSFHKARGGFLVLYIKDLLKDILLWELLKKSIVNKEIYINGTDILGIFSLSVGLTPSPVPGIVKVILIGDEYTYNLLSEFDNDFKKIFKVKAEFNNIAKINQDVINNFPILVKNIIESEDLKDVSSDGLEELFRYMVKLSENKNKIYLNFSYLTDVLREAEIKTNSDLITKREIKEVINEQIFRENLLEEKIIELIDEGKIIVDIEGGRIGQVNGLSVYEVGEYSFGKPSRITASAYIGEKGIINIEREVELSGPFHDKGVLIISGYLGRKYGTDFPLSLSCSITFEQSYGEVEGDSASLAELIAVLSEIGQIPVKQSIAITGSVDQHGNVQPVGGIKEKVSGFFKICKIKGLNGSHGVIVPKRNYDNIILDEEVIEAIEKNLFNIYLVDNVDEAIYILTDMDPLEFHREVKVRLEDFYKNSIKGLKNRF